MTLKVKISEKDGISIVKMTGVINSLSIEDLKIDFNNVKKAGNKNIILVMKKIKFMNSSGAGAILSLAKWADRIGGVVKIADVPKKIMEIFKLMRLDEIIEFYPSLSDALASFKS